MRHVYAAGMAVLAMTAVAAPAHAQIGDDGRYHIMRPEPGVPPKYQTPRGSPEHVTIPPSTQVAPPQAVVTAPLVIPQTGQVIPSQPILAPSGPRGTETSKDRAVRCAIQAGTYGRDRAAFVGTCINQ